MHQISESIFDNHMNSLAGVVHSLYDVDSIFEVTYGTEEIVIHQ